LRCDSYLTAEAVYSVTPRREVTLYEVDESRCENADPVVLSNLDRFLHRVSGAALQEDPMTAALVDFVLRFRERERENARQPVTLEIAEGVRVAVSARDRTSRRVPAGSFSRRPSALRA
jgi:hypothetical protein